MTPGSTRVTEGVLEEALWRLLTSSVQKDLETFSAQLAEVDELLGAAADPRWTAWRHALAARRQVAEGDLDGAAGSVGAARDTLEGAPPTASTALTLAYLAHVEVTADRADAAMRLAVDASLLTEGPAATIPTRELHQAHVWLSLALTGLDLEELAVAQALRGYRVAAAMPALADRWRLLRLCAQQHVELAHTLRRRGLLARSRRLAGIALRCAEAARDLAWEPEDPSAVDLLDIVQGWALTAADALDDALGPLRSAHRRTHERGGVWARGYADLALARLLVRLAARDESARRGRPAAEDSLYAAEATELLVTASGAFAAVGDRRRYRQCLLELGQCTAVMGRPAEALHWLEAYRADTGRANVRSREQWAELFVRRSRLRDAERQAAVLRRHALEDPLTGLGNRRSAERRLGELRPAEDPVSLAVVDIDHFKRVNDAHSHTHGDSVLRRVAELLREHSRTGDEVYRWAGDEFLVVLPRATEAQAVSAMERLRSAVATSEWAGLELAEPVTVSIGVASAALGGAGWRPLFDAADLHLFSAKRAGRDRVRASGADTSDGGPAT